MAEMKIVPSFDNKIQNKQLDLLLSIDSGLKSIEDYLKFNKTIDLKVSTVSGSMELLNRIDELLKKNN
jgi:hypothetical protein